MPRTLVRTLSWLACSAAAALALPAQADVSFTFDADAQGWTAVDGGALVYQASGGNSGGFLQVTDSSDADFLLVMPGASGDWSAYLGGTLSFDARNLNNESPDWPGFGELTLSGANLSVTVDGVTGNEPPADGQWHHYSINLNEASFGANLPAILGSLSGLTLKGEFHAGVTEVVGIDNILLAAAVPEPASWALLCLGGGLLLARRARQS